MFLLKFLFPTTGLFTIFSLLLALPSSTKGLTREKIWLLFLVSAAISASNLLLSIKKMGLYFKVATHFIALSGTVLLTLCLSGYMRTGRWVIILVAYILIYAIACPIGLLLYHQRIANKKSEAKGDYESVYERNERGMKKG